MMNDKQYKLDRRYLRMARIWAENSYCQRRQVGALVVKDKMIISDGYNGTPSGFENVCEDENAMCYMPKPMPSPSSHARAITATAQRFTSRHRPASNAPSLSYKQASSAWSTERNIVLKTASICCAAQILK